VFVATLKSNWCETVLCVKYLTRTYQLEFERLHTTHSTHTPPVARRHDHDATIIHPVLKININMFCLYTHLLVILILPRPPSEGSRRFNDFNSGSRRCHDLYGPLVHGDGGGGRGIGGGEGSRRRGVACIPTVSG
jgi:hypothetical protein